MGLLEAGFDSVVGIDTNKAHSRIYPGQFIHGDATKPPLNVNDFDFIWASPPCQAFSVATKEEHRGNHVNLIPVIRKLLAQHPYSAIENVPFAPMRADLTLTGPMVGLHRILRKRIFELSWGFMLTGPIEQVDKNTLTLTITTSLSSTSHFYKRKKMGLPGKVSVKEACEVMGITIPMTAKQVGEAVPPAYSKYIADEAIARINAEK